MSLRVRRRNLSIRSRLGRLVETEERQNFLVTALFVAAIVTTLLILVGAIALNWYDTNLRPLARVGAVELGPQLLRDRLNLEQWRVNREKDRITQAVIDGEIDSATAQSRTSALDQQFQAFVQTGLEDLVDLVFRSQLAAQEGIAVTDADIDARMAHELAGIEKRHVLAITVEPQAADEEAGPTFAERRAALARAEAALAQVNSGRAWADVAREFGTDDASSSGGDLGQVTPNSVEDQAFASELFDLEQGGTTTIVRGVDSAYRIGRVTEIVAAPEVPGLRDRLLADVAEANARQILGYQIAADRLQDKVVADALSETPEQVRLAVIYIEGFSSDDPAGEGGEVDYSEIVFAPADDLVTAPDLDPDDPDWAAAETDARTVFDQLSEVEDVEERKARFETLATALSDSPTAEDGGRVGFVTPEIPPSAVADALFDGGHTEGELIGPIRGDAAWYVLLFHEYRASLEERLQAVREALAQPGADFNQVARELSEGFGAEDGGEIGWRTRVELGEDLADDVFSLGVGEVSEPLELGDGEHYFIKVQEKAVRSYDADQIPNIRVSAFENWYADRREEAEANGTILIAGEEGVTDGDLEPGLDQP